MHTMNFTEGNLVFENRIALEKKWVGAEEWVYEYWFTPIKISKFLNLLQQPIIKGDNRARMTEKQLISRLN
jgi:hypothetical protein